MAMEEIDRGDGSAAEKFRSMSRMAIDGGF